jgi:hypothetical protein
MTAVTKAAFLVGLPLGAAWYFWHGHRFVAAALIAAAFTFIIGTNSRRDVPRKQAEENLHQQAKSDGRNAAKLMVARSQPLAPTAAELPTKSVAHLEDLWAQIARGLGKRQ